MASNSGGASTPIRSVMSAPQSPPCATNFLYPSKPSAMTQAQRDAVSLSWSGCLFCCSLGIDESPGPHLMRRAMCCDWWIWIDTFNCLMIELASRG